MYIENKYWNHYIGDTDDSLNLIEYLSNKGKKEVISKVQVRMQHPVRDDLLRYLQSGITIGESAE